MDTDTDTNNPKPRSPKTEGDMISLRYLSLTSYMRTNTGYHEKKYWYQDRARYQEGTGIFRPISTKKYLKKVKELRELELELLDKRWNWWHDYFKRKIFYRTMRIALRIAKRLKVI